MHMTDAPLQRILLGRMVSKAPPRRVTLAACHAPPIPDRLSKCRDPSSFSVAVCIHDWGVGFIGMGCHSIP